MVLYCPGTWLCSYVILTPVCFLLTECGWSLHSSVWCYYYYHDLKHGECFAYEVGIAEFWWWWLVLVSVTFAFCHLLISGVSCYSCLWLEIVPLMMLLASISRPGWLAFSSEFQWSEYSQQASSPLTGKVHSYLVFGPPPGRRWRPKTGPFPEAVLLWPVTEAVVSVVHTLTCADYFLRSPGTKMAPVEPEAKASRAG